MTSKPLHVHSDTHLYSGTFEEFAAEHISEDEEILVTAPDEETAEGIVSHLREHLGELAGDIETYSGDHSDVPYDSDSFDTAVHYNPGRGVLQRHVPLYEMTAVVRSGGQIIYRAPNYLAHSTSAEIDKLYALGWTDHGDPAVAGQFEVTAAGDPRDESDNPTDRAETTLSDF